jgi:hypothetical protein
MNKDYPVRFRVAAAVLALLICQVYSVSAPSSPETENFTQQELQNAYDNLPPEEKRAIENWPDEERINYLRKRARAARLQAAQGQSNAAEQDLLKPQSADELYVVDPQLKSAFEAYLNEKVPRDQVIKEFETYLENNPETPFRAEIYFRIAALYSMHRRVSLGEPYEHKKMIEYFQKAHEVYGEKYSYLHDIVWASLANMPESSLEFRKWYLKWLQNISQMTSEDIWPIRPIQQVLNGRPPELDEAEKQTIVKFFKGQQDVLFKVANLNIFYREGNNYNSLVDLANSFPNTELASQCSMRLKPVDDFYLGSLSLESSKAQGPWITENKEVRKVFVPDFEHAKKNKQPFIFELNGGTLLETPPVTTKKSAAEILKACEGILWCGGIAVSDPNRVTVTSRRLLEPVDPNARTDRSMEISKPLRMQDDAFGTIYLIRDGELPYVFYYDSRRSKRSYKVTIYEVLENGVFISAEHN